MLFSSLKMRISAVLSTVFILSLGSHRPAEAADIFSIFKKKATEATQAAGLESFSQEQLVQGLKEALALGAEHAVTNLGRPGGYLDQLDVRIPMPKSLKSVESTLRTLKQDALADQFITTMNQAAEQAVPEAAGILGDAIRSMTVEDAEKIIQGPEDAATQYFRKTSGDRLKEKMMPLIQEATARTGVTSSYKKITDLTGPATTFFGFRRKELDLDEYVAEQATEGLYKRMAEEEQQIRANPAARTTELLREIFSGKK